MSGTRQEREDHRRAAAEGRGGGGRVPGLPAREGLPARGGPVCGTSAEGRGAPVPKQNLLVQLAEQRGGPAERTLELVGPLLGRPNRIINKITSVDFSNSKC